jgi:hypothetical protein
MRDPHVFSLHYRLETGPQLAFNDPPPVEKETDAFSLRLANGQLRIEMKDHFATAEAARLEVEPFLRSWEIATALQHGANAIRFVFERAEMRDREPSPPGASVIQPMAAEAVLVGYLAVHRVTRRQYPDPPEAFVAVPDVLAMWERYEAFVTGRGDLLTNVAWWCLTTIERNSGGRARASARYAISDHVLVALHRLAHVGDEKTARKRFAGQELRRHSPAETAWMEAVVKRIIQRVGELASDPAGKWPKLTMADFPNLPRDAQSPS